MRVLLLALASILAVGCAAPPPKAPATALVPAPAPGWSTTPKDAGRIRVRVDKGASVTDLMRAMTAGAKDLSCAIPVFVWGDVRAPEAAPAMTVSAGDTAVDGWVVCDSDLEPLLKAQVANPRLKQAHGGSADLRFAEGQLLLRRRWGTGEAKLGDLSGDAADVLQKGELLAVVFSADDPRAPAAPMLAVLARVPSHFLFGMWPVSVGR